MKSASLKRLVICLAIAAAPTVAVAQGTAPTPSNQTGNNTPGQVLNDNPATPPGSAITNTGNPADRAAYDRAIAACDKLPMDQQGVCRASADKDYGVGSMSPSGAVMPKNPALTAQCEQLSGTARSDCLKSQKSGGK
jgi:hypothetical protein